MIHFRWYMTIRVSVETTQSVREDTDWWGLINCLIGESSGYLTRLG